MTTPAKRFDIISWMIGIAVVGIVLAILVPMFVDKESQAGVDTRTYSDGKRPYTFDCIEGKRYVLIWPGHNVGMMAATGEEC